MVAPFDYTSAFGQQGGPLGGLMQGLKLGATMQDIEAARAKQAADLAAQQQAVARQQQLGQAMQGLMTKQNPTFADYQAVAILAPKEQSEALLKSWDALSKEQQANDLRFSGQVLSAFNAETPDIGLRLLRERAEAERNAGRADRAKFWEDSALIAEKAPAGFAKATIGQMVSSLPGGKDVIESVNKAEEGRRAARMEPSVLKEAAAKADKAVADAITAQATATNAPERAAADAALARAQADKAKVDAKFAEQNVLADLKKKAADLGLTQAQTNSAIAQTRKLGVETATAALQLEALRATGGADPAKKFEQEEKIRKEWQGRSKIFNELSGTYSNIYASAGAKTGPGDIALITGFMKMLDPGSVVRETEFATARDTAGLFDRLANQAQKLKSGQLFTLDSKQRDEYVSLARQYLDAAQKKANQEKKDLGVVVKNYGLNPENVFGLGETAPPPGTSAAIPGAPVQPGQVAPAAPRAAPTAASPYAGMSNEELLRRLTQSPMPGGR